MGRLKKIPILALLAMLPSSKDMNYLPVLNQINLSVLVNQLLKIDSKHPEESIISEGLKYNKIKHNEITYHVITLKEQHQSNYKIRIETPKKPKRLEDFMSEDAIAGINGSFFKKEKTIGLVRSEGKNINNHKRISGSGFFTVENNVLGIKKEISDTTKYETILQSFPLLIYNDEILNVENEQKNFRSAIATDKNNNLYLITTYTNPFKKNKITLGEFAQFLSTQNYKNALNLDGGRSAQMSYQIQNKYYQNDASNTKKTYNHVRNHSRIKNAITISRRNK